MTRRRWYITAHAVARYIERCEPSMSEALARGILREASQTTVLVGRRRGAQLYRDPARPMHAEFVVSDVGELVTVLNPIEQSSDHDREAVYAPVRRQRRAA